MPAVGSYKILLLFIALLLIVGCKDEKTHKTLPPPKVTVVKPVQQEVTRYLEYTGTTSALESVEIRARVPGFLNKIAFTPGNRVKAGDLLFIIDPRSYQAEVGEATAKLDSQKASYKLAQTELQISQQLESKEAISSLRLEKKAAERDVSKAGVELAESDLVKAKLNLEWTQVTSPINGRVSRNLVDVGNLVGSVEKTLLTYVLNDSSIYVYFNISEIDALPIMRKRTEAKKTGASFTDQKFPVFMTLSDETEFKRKGRLDFVDPRVNSATGTIQVRGIFDNPDGMLVAGMFVKVRIPIEKKSAILVPAIAIQMDQAGSYVLVVDQDDKVQRRKITTGIMSGDLQVIEEGVNPEDAVIVYGIQRARPGLKVIAETAKPQGNSPAAGSDNKQQDK